MCANEIHDIVQNIENKEWKNNITHTSQHSLNTLGMIFNWLLEACIPNTPNHNFTHGILSRMAVEALNMIFQQQYNLQLSSVYAIQKIIYSTILNPLYQDYNHTLIKSHNSSICG